MRVTDIAIDALKEYENNPRDNAAAVEAVANSIKEFGFRVPVVIDRDNIIIAGHTRLKAAMHLGMISVPCIIADDLTSEQVKAYRLADNKTAELAEWDFAALERELQELTAFDVDMSKYGFDDSIFDIDGQEIDEADAPDVDEEAEPTVKSGEIWKLGRHYLMCGDSTRREEVEDLMSASGEP